MPEPLAADTPSTTAVGNRFVAPAGWTVRRSGPATLVDAPEAGSRIAIVDVRAPDADAAVAAAWTAYGAAARPLKAMTSSPDRDGWQDRRTYVYQTSPNEKREIYAAVMRHGEQWTVQITDLARAVAGKRIAQVSLISGQLWPKGYARESFAGRTAQALDGARLAEITGYVERAQQALGVPGASLGLVQGGKVVFAGGFGVRELGRPERVDADSLYLIASVTKGMTTLMLGTLVAEGKAAWDTPVTALLPSFKLGDATTTSQVQVKHLVCACTGLPRKDLEWLFGFERATAATALAALATVQPTSRFGEIFQYSNQLAAAAGYVGGHVAFPQLELGAAYDRAMQTRVFAPLGMTATTFDFARAQRGNHARPHSTDLDDTTTAIPMARNLSAVPIRPAAGAWSNVRDILKYVQVQISNGLLPSGERYIAESILQDRLAPQVAVDGDGSYGMGLRVERKYGTPVAFHFGIMPGYRSIMLWLPEHGVGAVLVANADSAWPMMTRLSRKLLEVLFDGRPEAEEDIAAAAKQARDAAAAERALLTVPADPLEVGKLAARYANPALGELSVKRRGGATTFDFGAWESAVVTRKYQDGTVAFYTSSPGARGTEFAVGRAGDKRTLVLRDAQNEYVYTEQ